MDHINHYDDCPELRRVDELIQNYYLKGDYETCFQGCLELAEGGLSPGGVPGGVLLPHWAGDGCGPGQGALLDETGGGARRPGRAQHLHCIARAKAGENFSFSDHFDTLKRGNMTLKLIEKKARGRVQLPYYYYDILVDGVPVGKISIRIGDNFHTSYNGHIGYEVDPEFQGHGYARQACELVLEVARSHGMPSVLLTCAEDNAPSYHTIEKLGAKLLCITDVPKEYFAWYEGIPRHRVYQLDL